ncbi:MAG: DUF308 domain-containing protein [Bacillota bacterium]
MVSDQFIEVVQKKRSHKILTSIIFLIFGVFLLIFPQNGLAFIALLLSVVLLILAVIYVIQFLRTGRVEKSRLGKGLVALAFAILLLVFRTEVASIILPAIIGIGILALAVVGVMNAVSYKNQSLIVWWIPLVGALIAVIVSILIFNNLQATSSLVAMIIGLFLVIFGVIGLFEWGTIRSLARKIK